MADMVMAQTWCEGCGPHEDLAACSECGHPILAGVLVDHAMTERAARAWWAHESDSDVAWADVAEAVRNGYRARAREALSAALMEEADG